LEDPQARLLDAAHRLFVRHGVAATRMQDVADEAGVTRALLHYYFRTKDRLAEAVCLRVARDFARRMLSAFEADVPLRQNLQRAAEAQLDFLEAHPYVPGYLAHELVRRGSRLLRTLEDELGTLAPLRRSAVEGLQRQIDAEVEAGRLRPATRALDVMQALQAHVVYPYVGAPLLRATLGLDPRDAATARNRPNLADTLLRQFAA
jgi:AcrR family transcriptional regulator